ncbi:hypothetical protein FPK15_contig00026-0031 [Flavobacterium psychrophilum]|nr:hypothetical protein FPK15_contig00026-0031 [Flavobacterium psychrophilum]GAW89758.1 hypothetical protein FPS14_contig00029-0036 [Flavobacterium psychrophilum]
MISISHKAKQFLILAIKLSIVVAAFYFIFHQLATNDKLDWTKFIVLFKKKQSVLGIVFILFLSFVNRFFEILKWQNLVSSFKIISLGEATKQVLASLTAGIFTPNGIGEYAGKTLYFEKSNAKKIIFLNLLCNGIQLILTIILGTIGLLFLGYTFWGFAILVFVLVFLVFVFFRKKYS